MSTEEDTSPSGPRVDAENYEIALAGRGVHSSVVRISPITHSAELDRHGFATVLIATARRTGVSAHIEDGENHWPAAHTLDTAHLFRLALEKAPAGSRLHAVSEEGVTTKAITTGSRLCIKGSTELAPMSSQSVWRSAQRPQGSRTYLTTLRWWH